MCIHIHLFHYSHTGHYISTLMGVHAFKHTHAIFTCTITDNQQLPEGQMAINSGVDAQDILWKNHSYVRT